MTDFAKVFNIYSTEATPADAEPQENNSSFGEVKRANASKSKKKKSDFFFNIIIIY